MSLVRGGGDRCLRSGHSELNARLFILSIRGFQLLLFVYFSFPFFLIIVRRKLIKSCTIHTSYFQDQRVGESIDSSIIESDALENYVRLPNFLFRYAIYQSDMNISPTMTGERNIDLRINQILPISTIRSNNRRKKF